VSEPLIHLTDLIFRRWVVGVLRFHCHVWFIIHFWFAGFLPVNFVFFDVTHWISILFTFPVCMHLPVGFVCLNHWFIWFFWFTWSGLIYWCAVVIFGLFFISSLPVCCRCFHVFWYVSSWLSMLFTFPVCTHFPVVFCGEVRHTLRSVGCCDNDCCYA
jgi:hypothetical protein